MCIYIHIFIHTIYIFFFSLSIYFLSIYLSVHPFISDLFISLSLYLFISLSTYIYISLSLSLSLSRSLSLFLSLSFFAHGHLPCITLAAPFKKSEVWLLFYFLRYKTEAELGAIQANDAHWQLSTLSISLNYEQPTTAQTNTFKRWCYHLSTSIKKELWMVFQCVSQCFSSRMTVKWPWTQTIPAKHCQEAFWPLQTDLPGSPTFSQTIGMPHVVVVVVVVVGTPTLGSSV